MDFDIGFQFLWGDLESIPFLGEYSSPSSRRGPACKRMTSASEGCHKAGLRSRQNWAISLASARSLCGATQLTFGIALDPHRIDDADAMTGLMQINGEGMTIETGRFHTALNPVRALLAID